MNGDELLGGEAESKAVEVLESGGRVFVLVDGRVYMCWESGDDESQRMAVVQLYECGRGTQEQLADAFSMHLNSVQKYITDYARDGFGGLASRRRGPHGGWEVTPWRRGKILAVALREGIRSVEAVQVRLREGWHEEISQRSIRRVFEENGLLNAESLEAEGPSEQGDLFEFQADRQLDLNLGLDEDGDVWFSDGDTLADEQIQAPETASDAGVFPRKRSQYSLAQRIYFDRLEQGDYNAYAGGLLFAPLLAQYEYLLQKIPELIEKAKKLGRAAGLSREVVENLIVLFDREGYSAELYRYFEGKGEGVGKRRAIFISWAKYADKWVYDIDEAALDKTVKVFYAIRKPEDIRCVEITRSVNKYGKIRAIVIQSGKQKRRAAIFTNASAEDLSVERVVRLMCRRWGEENQIKELLLKHMINYMPGYVPEDLDEQPWVENPKVKELKKRRVILKGELRRFKVQLADDMLDQSEQPPRPINAERFPIMESIVRTENEILLLNGQLDDLSAEVRFDEAHDGLKLMKLNYEKKRFLGCIKVFSCNLNEAMCRMLLKYYDRRKEILPALSMIVDRAGEVKLQDGELRVRLRSFRNQEIDYAARRLCEDLNNMAPRTLDRFRIPLRYEVA